MWKILDNLKMILETHHDIYLPAGQCWHMIYTLNFYKIKNKKKTSQKKFDVNARYPRGAWWDFRGVLDDSLFLYLEFNMNKYWKNWGNYEVLRMKLGDLLLLLLLFLYWCFMGSCAALQWFCMRIWIVTVLTVSYLQFVYIYIYSTSLFYAALIFLWCSVAFVILPVSILLVFMPLFSETCPFFYCSSLTEDPLGLLPAHSVAGARSPRYTIKFLTTCLLQFFIFYYSFCA